jgi:hypothetical protein
MKFTFNVAKCDKIFDELFKSSHYTTYWSTKKTCLL